MRTLILICSLAIAASQVSAQTSPFNPIPFTEKGGNPPTINSYNLEDFEGQRFPPAGWLLEYSGALYWKWFPGASGYGIGSVSAMFDFGSAPTGTTQSLVFLLPVPSASGDSIRFDHAYATYHVSLIDRLVLQVSHDGGLSYTTLVTLNGGASGPLTTAPPTKALFVPTASQWATKSYALPVGTNRIRFTAISAWGNNLFLDNCTVGHRLVDDVGVQVIDIANPGMAVPQIPKVLVKNLGTLVQTFPVTMIISPGGYSSTKTISALAGNASSEVLFDQWTPVPGLCTVAVYTELAADQDKLNDTLRTPVTVNEASTATNIDAFYRHGQVFITWDNLSMINVLYTVYRATSPIRHGYDLMSAQNLGTVRDSSALDRRLTNLSGGVQKYLRIDSASAPLASNRGVFVATSTADDSFYYAVTANAVGTEDTTIIEGVNTVTMPVGESIRMPQPVWQESRLLSGRTFEIYVQYATKVTSPIYPQLTNVGSYPFHFAIIKSGTVSPHPVTFWLHGAALSFLPSNATNDFRATGDPNEWVITIDDWTPNASDFNLSFYYGYHDRYDLFSTTNPVPTSGTLVNYTSARVIHTVDWVLKNLPVDTTRAYMTGFSMGGSGTIFNSLMIPSKLAAILVYAPTLDLASGPSTNPGFDIVLSRLWGTRQANLPTNQGFTRNERLDIKFLLGAHEDNSFPVVFTFSGKADITAGWDEKIPFYRLMDSLRFGGYHFWGNTDHGNTFGNSPWRTNFPDFSFFTRYRTNLSYPAFSNCSINDNPGNGDPSDGDVYGTINGHLDWADDIIDTTNRWEVTLRLKNLSTTYGSLPAPDSAIVDVTLRRLQVYDPIPGETIIQWTNLAGTEVVQEGSFNYTGGLITIPGVKVYKASNRLVLRSLPPTAVNVSTKTGWNMVSVPTSVNDYGKGILFPGTVSPAYAYQGNYLARETLAKGSGYWMKFSSPQTIPIHGFMMDIDTIDVDERWNIVGSISYPVAVNSIVSIPPGMIVSGFYHYADTSYALADTIYPGCGYWVKVTDPGKFILSASPAATASTKRIRIVGSDELPPPPPADGKENSMSMVIPAECRLDQNYPNPFNPVTTIGYALPEAGHVRLSVYNLLGQEVRVLVDEHQVPGYRTLSLDAGNMPSGVYTLRLTAGTFTETRKMLLMK